MKVSMNFENLFLSLTLECEIVLASVHVVLGPVCVEVDREWLGDEALEVGGLRAELGGQVSHVEVGVLQHLAQLDGQVVDLLVGVASIVQVWSLTQFHSLDFAQSWIGV